MTLAATTRSLIHATRMTGLTGKYDKFVVMFSNNAMVALRFVQSESEQVVLKHANQGYLFLQ
jgi:hypothetical protein